MIYGASCIDIHKSQIIDHKSKQFMLERFIDKTTFESQEDFIKNFKIKVPENFNFGYDVVDAWAEEEPDKKALCWTNDHGEHIDLRLPT